MFNHYPEAQGYAYPKISHPRTGRRRDMASPMTLPENTFIDDEGVWNQVFASARDRSGGALFLDRDGVIVDEVNYLHKVADVRAIPAAAEVIQRANRLGVPVIIVTNQAGVGRGLYDWAAFAAVQQHILAGLARAGAGVDAVYACPHHQHAEAPWTHPDHPARKPNPGMLLRAARALAIDLTRSWIVGDRAGDLEAGRRAGIAGGLHVMTGHGATTGERELALAVGDDRYKAIGIADIGGALDHVPLLRE